MAKSAPDTAGAAPQGRFDMRALWRLVTWGGSAAAALAVAALAATSQPGTQRLAGLGRATAQSPAPDVVVETSRLVDAVRVLATDRDRMLSRIATLEQNLDDVTGAISRNAKGPPTASAPTPAVPSANGGTADA